MAAVPGRAGVSAANIYRYHTSGRMQLSDTVVTDEVRARVTR